MLISVWIVWPFWPLASETPGSPITLRYTPSVTLDGCDHCSTLILRDAPTETEEGRNQATAGSGRDTAGNGWRRQASGNGWRQPCGQFCGQQLAGCIHSRAICLGHFSPQLIQKIAALACSDFDRAREQEESPLDDLRNLAQLGSRGAFPDNIHRDLMARMSAQVHLPEPFAINMPFKAPLGDRMQSVLLPHEMFASLYHD